MRTLVLLSGFVCMAILAGCASRNTEKTSLQTETATPVAKETATPANIARVKVDKAGQIFLNDKPITLKELRRAFFDLKNANGSVWFYRENYASEPLPEATAVIQAVIDAQLPIRLSTRPDYSDSVSLDGRPTPPH